MGGVFTFRWKDLFESFTELRLTVSRLHIIQSALRIGLALLLIGHGGFGAVVEKEMLLDHFGSIGIQIDLVTLIYVGYFEMVLGFLVLLWPTICLLWIIFVWKVFTEFLYVTDGGLINIWEFVERAGNYGIPIALILILRSRKL